MRHGSWEHLHRKPCIQTLLYAAAYTYAFTFVTCANYSCNAPVKLWPSERATRPARAHARAPTLCLSDPPRAMPGPAALWYLSICYFISGYSCELGSRALFARTPVRGTARRRGQNPPLPPRLHTTTVTHRPILCERHMSTCHPMPIPDPTLAQSAHVLRGPTDLAVNGRPS